MCGILTALGWLGDVAMVLGAISLGYNAKQILMAGWAKIKAWVKARTSKG